MAERTDQALVAPSTRPVGLRLGAVLLLLFSIFGLAGAFTGILAWRGDALLILLYGLGGVLSLIELVLVWGLWSLKPWAFWTTVGTEVVCIVIALSASASLHASSSLLTNLVFPFAILLCMFVDPNVRPALQKQLDNADEANRSH